ncbi:MAG: thioredoxin [Alphaproteobacteria bacterium]|nr:thioredoxin [Alphaproteobacteria bacterium]
MDIIGAKKSAAAGATRKSPHVSDGSDKTFMADVLEPSKTAPVIVDFWAPWCGPCRTLGPVIEKVVDEAKGAVKLVKIDIDKNPGVAGQLGVQSIPAVIAFKGGRPVDGFMGAVPESQIRAFIARLADPAADLPEGPNVAELLAAAEEASDAGDFAGAAELYAAVLTEESESIEALSGLARCYLRSGDIERARQVADMIPEANRKHPSASAIFSTLDLASHIAEPDEALELTTRVRNSPGDLDARFDLASLLAGQSKHDDAAEQLLAILEKNLQWRDGAAREQLLKIFEAAGPKADVTRDGRRRLSALMFR